MDHFVFINHKNLILVKGSLSEDLQRLFEWIISNDMCEMTYVTPHYQKIDASFGVVKFFGCLLLDLTASRKMKTTLTVFDDYGDKEYIEVLECMFKETPLIIFTGDEPFLYRGQNLQKNEWFDCIDFIKDIFPKESQEWLELLQKDSHTDSVNLPNDKGKEEESTCGVSGNYNLHPNTPELREYQEGIMKIWNEFDMLNSMKNYPDRKLAQNIILCGRMIEILKYHNPLELNKKEKNEQLDHLLTLEMTFKQYQTEEYEELNQKAINDLLAKDISSQKEEYKYRDISSQKTYSGSENAQKEETYIVIVEMDKLILKRITDITQAEKETYKQLGYHLFTYKYLDTIITNEVWKSKVLNIFSVWSDYKNRNNLTLDQLKDISDEIKEIIKVTEYKYILNLDKLLKAILVDLEPYYEKLLEFYKNLDTILDTEIKRVNTLSYGALKTQYEILKIRSEIVRKHLIKIEHENKARIIWNKIGILRTLYENKIKEYENKGVDLYTTINSSHYINKDSYITNSYAHKCMPFILRTARIVSINKQSITVMYGDVKVFFDIDVVDGNINENEVVIIAQVSTGHVLPKYINSETKQLCLYQTEMFAGREIYPHNVSAMARGINLIQINSCLIVKDSLMYLVVEDRHIPLCIEGDKDRNVVIV